MCTKGIWFAICVVCYQVGIGRYGLMSMWHSRARSGLRMACWDGEGRGCQGMCLCMVRYIWDCGTVILFDCVTV